MIEDLDPKQKKLNKLGVELCEGHISYVVRNDTHHMGEMAIENYLSNLREDEDDLTEADKDYLYENSLFMMQKAMDNLNI